MLIIKYVCDFSYYTSLLFVGFTFLSAYMPHSSWFSVTFFAKLRIYISWKFNHYFWKLMFWMQSSSCLCGFIWFKIKNFVQHVQWTVERIHRMYAITNRIYFIAADNSETTFTRWNLTGLQILPSDIWLIYTFYQMTSGWSTRFTTWYLASLNV